MEGAKPVDWEDQFRSLSINARDFGADPAADPAIVQSVRSLREICREGRSEDIVAKVYPTINKLFQRCVSALPKSRTTYGLLLLEILQFFIDFGDAFLHDADSSLRTFMRSCLSREFADPIVAEATLNFLSLNKKKILFSFPGLFTQFFPLLLKLIAWNGERLEVTFSKILPAMISQGSFLPLLSSLIDLPILVMALEKVGRNSGTLVGSSIATIQKSTAPEMLLALMDEAYTGTTIKDRGASSGSDDNDSIDVADSLFLDLLKDENDGLAARDWMSPDMDAALQASVNATQSDRLRQALRMTPNYLDVYFRVALWDASDSLVCALIPLLMSRNAALFPDKFFAFEVRKRSLEFILDVFQRWPEFIALLKKPIIDRLTEACGTPEKTELALYLCWAIGEHAGGGISHKDDARELFESLELLLYENISSSRLGLSQEAALSINAAAAWKSSQSRLLCFVVTAIAKLATLHHELLPRARVSLAKVARSHNLGKTVWKRACDFLALMDEPAICMSILGPPNVKEKGPGVVNWNEAGSKMIAHIPFYILKDHEGPPFFDFSFSDIIHMP
ncbi:AP-5 complex subunit zeta-1 [Wolffia australiana]